MFILKEIGKDFFTFFLMGMRMIGMVMGMMEMQCVHEAD